MSFIEKVTKFITELMQEFKEFKQERVFESDEINKDKKED